MSNWFFDLSLVELCLRDFGVINCCLCVCVCACVRAGGRAGVRAGVRACVRACVCGVGSWMSG